MDPLAWLGQPPPPPALQSFSVEAHAVPGGPPDCPHHPQFILTPLTAATRETSHTELSSEPPHGLPGPRNCRSEHLLSHSTALQWPPCPHTVLTVPTVFSLPHNALSVPCVQSPPCSSCPHSVLIAPQSLQCPPCPRVSSLSKLSSLVPSVLCPNSILTPQCPHSPQSHCPTVSSVSHLTPHCVLTAPSVLLRIVQTLQCPHHPTVSLLSSVLTTLQCIIILWAFLPT